MVHQLDLVLANSDFTARNVEAAFGVKALTCYPGIEFGPEEVATVPPGTVLLSIARLDASKNLVAVLRAIVLLRERGPLPFSEYVIAGSGPQEASLREFVESNDLHDVVRFAGEIHGLDKESLYDEAGLFVLPCLDEGFGLVFVEAAAHGRAGVGPDHGGPAEIIVDGTTGWLADPLSPESIADAIATGFADRGRLEDAGVAAWERARTEFDADSFAGRFQAALLGLHRGAGQFERGPHP